jgi:prepilin-type N-terminal cleavage/methylation domain-containing protein
MAKTNRGFTLIELLIVISLIGIMAALGGANYMTSLKRGRDTQRKAGLLEIKGVLETYRADKGSYPLGSAPNNYIHGCGAPTCGTLDCSWGNAWQCGSPTSTYMQIIPDGPLQEGFRYFSDGLTYYLETCLEYASDPQGIAVGSSRAGYSGGNCTTGKIFQITNP